MNGPGALAPPKANAGAAPGAVAGAELPPKENTGADAGAAAGCAAPPKVNVGADVGAEATADGPASVLVGAAAGALPKVKAGVEDVDAPAAAAGASVALCTAAAGAAEAPSVNGTDGAAALFSVFSACAGAGVGAAAAPPKVNTGAAAGLSPPLSVPSVAVPSLQGLLPAASPAPAGPAASDWDAFVPGPGSVTATAGAASAAGWIAKAGAGAAEGAGSAKAPLAPATGSGSTPRRSSKSPSWGCPWVDGPTSSNRGLSGRPSPGVAPPPREAAPSLDAPLSRLRNGCRSPVPPSGVGPAAPVVVPGPRPREDRGPEEAPLCDLQAGAWPSCALAWDPGVTVRRRGVDPGVEKGPWGLRAGFLAAGGDACKAALPLFL